MMNAAKKRTVACPACKHPAEFSPDNPYRPFCSKRCKMIDLGLWASEQYAIPSDAKSDQFDDSLPTQ